MTSHPAYDLAPIGLVALIGLGLALLALAWLAWRQRTVGGDWRLRLTQLTLFLTFDLIVFGAFTRLTDSGLGCPDWPGCYGTASPAHAHAAISSAQAALPSGPVTHGKAWIEMIHRYLATGVGALILLICVQAWRDRLRHGARSNPGLASFTLFWVCVQGAFGALTVTMKLFPAIVTLHLLGGMLLLALLAWQSTRTGEPGAVAHGVPAALRILAVLGLAALTLQIALGGWVSTNYAVLACRDFPTCQGRWWPEMDLRAGFTLWRPLGQMPDGTPIAFPALTGIHMVHRMGALVVLALLLALAHGLWRIPPLRRAAAALVGLLLAQVVSGMANVVLGWPLLAALLHTAGAACLVMLLTWLLAATSARPAGLRRDSRWQEASA